MIDMKLFNLKIGCKDLVIRVTSDLLHMNDKKTLIAEH